jgi:sec-independent protein translocase protein TatA
MGSLGWQEIVIVFVVALVIFGPKKLPEIGKSLGKGIAEFKRATNELKQTWEDEVQVEKASTPDVPKVLADLKDDLTKVAETK